MLTIDALRSYGANVEEGLTRCVNNEAFYLKLVGKTMDDPSFERLTKAIENKDLDDAFEATHALKGALGNLALTPLCEPVNEMVELLRAKEDADYDLYIEEITNKKKALEELIG